MRRIAIAAACALGALVVYSLINNGQTAAHAADCRYAGTWVADNGDTMILGGINSSADGGSYRFRTAPNAFLTMNIDGAYRLEGAMFHFKGNDQYQSLRDVSMPMSVDNPTSPTLIGLGYDNKVTGRGVQVFHLRQRDSTCQS